MGFNGKYRPLVSRIFIATVAGWMCLLAHSATAACRQALVLGLDVSGSVDTIEYAQQVQGLITALGSPTVQDAILSDPSNPVALSVFEWSGPASQRIILPWTILATHGDIDTAIAQLQKIDRKLTDVTTAIGHSILFANNLLAQQSHCWQATFDISGDGKSNTGPRPQDIRDLNPALTINALVVGASAEMGRAQADFTAELSAYYSAFVVTPGIGFVEVALGYQDYARAMERKLIKELQVMTIGAVSLDQ